MKQKLIIKTHRIIYADKDKKTIKKHYYEENETEYNVIHYQEPIQFWDDKKKIDTDLYEQQVSQYLDKDYE